MSSNVSFTSNTQARATNFSPPVRVLGRFVRPAGPSIPGNSIVPLTDEGRGKRGIPLWAPFDSGWSVAAYGSSPLFSRSSRNREPAAEPFLYKTAGSPMGASTVSWTPSVREP